MTASGINVHYSQKNIRTLAIVALFLTIFFSVMSINMPKIWALAEEHVLNMLPGHYDSVLHLEAGWQN